MLPGVLLGYSENRKAYVVQLLGSGDVIDAVHVFFDETSRCCLNNQ